MTDKVVVLVTCGSDEEAERIARALVEARLAACVNILGSVRSIYRWEEKLNDDQEVLLLIKTSRSLFDQVRRTVEKAHSYEVPEVICLPIIDGAPNYLNWLADSVAESPQPTAPTPKPQASRPKPANKKRS